jgi:hypothetical protein
MMAKKNFRLTVKDVHALVAAGPPTKGKAYLMVAKRPDYGVVIAEKAKPGRGNYGPKNRLVKRPYTDAAAGLVALVKAGWEYGGFPVGRS